MESTYIKKIFAIGIFLIVFCIGGCKKLVEVAPPVTSTTGASVYNSDATAAAVLTGLYTQLAGNSSSTNNSIPSITMWTGLLSDEFTLWSGVTTANLIAYYRNALSANTVGAEFWLNIYPYIFTCNSAIEGLNNSSSLTPAVKKQLLGEAKFMRAFFYFYLVNLYGDVPLVTITDYTINASLARTPQEQVYLQIISDLKDALELLNEGYVKADAVTIYPIASAERVRPNKWAATALLARVYLYKKDYVNAEAQATAIINNSAMYSLNSLSGVFLKASLGNNEAIWQLPSVSATITNTQEGYLFVLPSAGPNLNNPVYLNTTLLNSFEVGDLRKSNVNWINSVTVGINTYYYPYKYKIGTLNSTVTEYLMLLRLGEQYLIRAEARAQQGNISGSQSDLNIIRTRAGLLNTTAATQPALLTAILHERQVELFAELGQRWLDLKRSGTVDAVMGVVTQQKGGTWNTYQQLFPIPIVDIQRDPNITQNPGY